MLSLSTLFFNAAPAHAAKSDWGGVKNLYNGLCWAVAGASAANNAKIVQYTCDPLKPQSQRFEWFYNMGETEDTYVMIYIRNDDFFVGYSGCVAVAGGSKASLAQIVQFDCDSEDRSLWQIKYVGPTGTYQIKNKHSGLCITQDGLSRKINAVLVQYTCDGQSARRWYDYLPD